MKRFLAVTALLAATSTQATELKFGDLNYFFKEKQVNFGADMFISSQKYQVSAANYEKESFPVLAHVNYGILNNLYASFDFGYDYKAVTKTSLAGYRNDGFKNPRFGLNYRAFNQDDLGFNVDFGALYTLQTGDAERGNGQKDGNANNARAAAELNLRVGKKFNEANEVFFLGGFIRNLDGEYTQLQATSSSYTVKQDASNDYYVGAFYQYRPVNEFMVNFGVQGTHFGKIDDKAAGVSGTVEAHTDYEIKFNARYLITESIIAKFYYSQGNQPDYKLDGSEVKRRHLNVIGLGVDFLF